MPWLLYVDDDKDDRDVFREICNEVQPGIKCVLAVDGREAIEKIEETEPPLCIYIDMNMPVMDGLEVLKSIKQHPNTSSVPVFILSTSKSTSLEREAKSTGATDYLIKPADYEGFIKLLRSCLIQHTNVSL